MVVVVVTVPILWRKMDGFVCRGLCLLLLVPPPGMLLLALVGLTDSPGCTAILMRLLLVLVVAVRSQEGTTRYLFKRQLSCLLLPLQESSLVNRVELEKTPPPPAARPAGGRRKGAPARKMRRGGGREGTCRYNTQDSTYSAGTASLSSSRREHLRITFGVESISCAVIVGVFMVQEVHRLQTYRT